MGGNRISDNSCLRYFFLIKTLREQQQITRIEQANFRKQYLPRPEISGFNNFTNERDKFNFVLHIRDNPMKSLQIDFEHNGAFSFVKEDWNRLPFHEINLGYSTQVNVNRTAAVATRNFTYEFKIILKFEDINSNIYQQLILGVQSQLLLQSPVYIGNSLANSKNNFRNLWGLF